MQVLQSRTHLYFAMPKVGSNAFELVSSHLCVGGISEGTVLNVIWPIIDALCHLHEAGFAHRDVKSESILVDFSPNQHDPQRPVINHVCLIGNTGASTILHYCCLMFAYRNVLPSLCLAMTPVICKHFLFQISTWAAICP